MPGVSRTQRAEAKYNVTLDFPHLGLHSAASSGNLGLVTYALEHGQPVNSVVDGVLPLHVASSGGNDLIVKLLIERGADVNAPRLPRKYSNDKHRDTSNPIVGSSGSTPLHFAAANGHEKVVTLLLQYGAHPTRADKHGIIPEVLARQNGWTRCAEILSKWCHEKDRDLRERETLKGIAPAPELEPSTTTSRLDSLEDKAFETKLKVKRSIDTAINMFRPPFPSPPSSGQFAPDASYTTSPPPMAGFAPFEPSPDASTAEEFFPRRPSLPHIFECLPHHHIHSQSQSQSSNQHHSSKSTGRPSFSSSRRPRSAGTDAEGPSQSIAGGVTAPAPASMSSTPGRVRGKISLRHMFKKYTGDGNGAPTTPESRDSLSGYTSSGSASPTPERERERRRGSSAHSPLRTRASESGPIPYASSSASVPAPGSSQTQTLSPVPSSRSRLASESQSSSTDSVSAGTYHPPLAVELHHKLSRERLRNRSGSGSSADPHAQSPSPQPPALPHSHRSPPVRPSILRPHGRSASSGQSQSQPPQILQQSGDGSTSARSLRFDPSSTAVSLSTKRSGLNVDLKGSQSVNSLRNEPSYRDMNPSPRSPGNAMEQQFRDVEGETRPLPPPPRRPRTTSTTSNVDDEDEEGYGEVISTGIGLGLGLGPAVDSKSRQSELKSGGRQFQRQPSFGSQMSRESSVSPDYPSPPHSPTEEDVGSPEPPMQEAAPHTQAGFDCPFSINRPPLKPLPSLDAAHSSPAQSQTQTQSRQTPQGNLLGIHGVHGVDNRMRGDSFGSSMSASTDASMPQTPNPGPALSLGLGLGLQMRSPDATSLDLPLDSTMQHEEVSKARTRVDSNVSALADTQQRVGTMSPASRARAPPLDIDIRAISSHAQAEALVQRAQKSIIEMEDVDIELPGLGLVGGVGVGIGAAVGVGVRAGAGVGASGPGTTGSASGRTPLSAKLAAYGESLAIERRFKQKEARERGTEASGEFGSPTTPSRNQLRPRRSESAVRNFSLDGRPGNVNVLAPAPRRKKPRRPHTADGETSDHTGGFLAPGIRQLSPGHQHSFSGSAITHSNSNSNLRPSPSSDKSAFLRPPTTAHTLPVQLITTPSSLSSSNANLGLHTPPRIVRSRTPEPDTFSADVEPILTSTSHPHASGSSFGVPLSRVSTAPPRHASPDIIPQRSISEQERERARANKLMKMGLLAHEPLGTGARAQSPFGHARNGGSGGGGGGTGFGTGSSRHRFGGLRGFVQTLTGKS